MDKILSIYDQLLLKGLLYSKFNYRRVKQYEPTLKRKK